ncbi:MAG: DUF1223 domain-containing protein [Acidobacteriota bacterium]
MTHIAPRPAQPSSSRAAHGSSRILGILLPFAIALAAVALGVFALASDAPAAADTGADARPVVIELFTSQGCSSCPPADRLLGEIGDEPGVIPLAFHVDYWNHLGWRDPFSDRAWSARQQQYAAAFNTNRIYTPQAVIDGHHDVVGSDRRSLLRRIRDARAQPAEATVDLAVAPQAETLALTVDIALRSAADGAPPQVLVAITEDGLTTPVPRGENAHRTLRNDRVVRHLQPLDAAFTAGHAAVRAQVALDPAWQRDRLRVAVLVQDRASQRILGAAADTLAPDR